jgi:demethoxyubiquinone hydroxylase (CLK1/Coq7/Cat5 family)
MLHRVALVRTDASEERIASIIRVTRIGELGTIRLFLRSVLLLLVTNNIVPSSPIVVTLIMETTRSS